MKAKHLQKGSHPKAAARDRRTVQLSDQQKDALRKRRQQQKKQAAIEAHSASKKYIKKLKEKLLQPSRKLYGGLGYAKESVFLELDDPNYAEKFEELWNEHIPGFSGKSFKKRKAAGGSMLWQQRLQEKSSGQTVMNADDYVSKLTSTSEKMPRRSSHEAAGEPGHHGRHGKASTPAAQMTSKPHGDQPKKKRRQEQTTVVGDAAALQAQAIAAYRKLKASTKARSQGS